MGKKKGGALYSKYAQHKQFLLHPLKEAKWTTFLSIIVLDILFYLSLFGAVSFGRMKVQEKSATITLPDELRELSQQQAELLLPEVKGYYYFLLMVAILTTLAIIVSWSLFKGMIWALVTKNKASLRYFKSFFIFNIPWLVIWTIIFAIFFALYQPPSGQLAFPVVIDSLMDVLLFPISIFLLATSFIMKNIFFVLPVGIFIMITNTIYVLFPHQPGWRTVKHGVKLGFSHLIHLIIFHFVLFYCYLFVYVATSEIMGVLPPLAGQLGTSFLILAYFALARYYLASIISTLGKPETIKRTKI